MASADVARRTGQAAERNNILLITLRNAQVRRISWVRGVRPARGRCEWPPHDTASGRPPSPFPVCEVFYRGGYSACAGQSAARHLPVV